MGKDINNLAISILEQTKRTIEPYFQEILARYARQTPPRLLEAISYSLLAGGKRLRPALVLESYRACGGEIGRERESGALAAAAAIEMIHTFSLIHDDLPAMDDDDLRRGRPTNHKVFGEAMAILAGDALVAMAFEVLSLDAPALLVAHLAGELATAAGPGGMIGGQVLDMQAENTKLDEDELSQMHSRKTGAMLVGACRLGGIAADADQQLRMAVSRYGHYLGLAFQIADDLLDVTSTREQMGKATGKDADRGKNTYPGLFGVEASQRMARDAADEACKSLCELGSASNGLAALARFAVERTM